MDNVHGSGFVGVWSFFLLASGALAGSLTLPIEMPEEGVRIEPAGMYQAVSIQEGLYPSWDPPGSPRLPVLMAHVLLPVGAKATRVQGNCDDVLLASGVTVYPVQPACPFSDTNQPAFVPPDPQWYGRDEPFPSERAVLSGTSKMRGQSIAAIAIYPAQYLPARGEVRAARHMTLTVDYDDAPPSQRAAATEPEFAPNDHAFDDDIAGLVVNPEALTPTPATTASGGTREYLVITEGSGMIDAFWRLAMYRATNDGFAVTVKSISGINASYAGRDTQERIRNCIKDYVVHNGTVYVVLGGDDTIVPDRDAWARVWITNWVVDAQIPADAYYSNLDGTWDADGDKVYGELADDVDFDADVWVGRIPVRTASEASNYVSKLMTYENTVQGYAGNMLMGGVELWYTYPGTNRPSDAVNDGLPGFQAHDPVSDSEMWVRRLYRDRVQAYGFNPSRFGFYADTVTSRDTNWAGEYAISGTVMRDLLEEGWYHVFYQGHGHPGGIEAENGAVSDNDVTGCTRPPVGIFMSGTCLAGAFDDPRTDPCFSEALLRNRRGGALAYVGCSRYGIGYRDPLPADNTSDGGPSFDFAREFYKQVFSIQRTRLGSAFGNHKTALSVMVGEDDSYHRWLEFGINLQGDPAMPLPSLADITPPSPAPEFAQPIEALSSTSIRLTSTAVADSSGVEYQFAETGGVFPPSAWSTNRIQVITQLTPFTLYHFTVQARDQSANHNLTALSPSATIITPQYDGDVTAPTPNPMTFSSMPTAINPTTVVMTAATASDPSGVEYFFGEFSLHEGGASSGWQASPAYTNTHLQPGVSYMYSVQARDKSANRNLGTESAIFDITMPGLDAWDPADDTGATATALSEPLLTIQTHGPHVLSSLDLADWYSIRLSAGSSNTFSTPGGTGDDYGELFTDPQGTNRVAYNDDAAGGGQFRFTYVPTITTTFYLRVRNVWPGGDCAYTLQWFGSSEDPNPPYPDPMRFASLPVALSPSGVTMTAETASDNNGVEYLFEETTGHAGGESGAWQDGTTFSNMTLQPETAYAYRVRARDKSARQNLTDWSEERQVTTPPVVSHDAWDPADDLGATATALPSPTRNEQTHGEHSLNGTDTEDWFEIYLEEGTTNTFRSISEMGDPVAYLSRQPDGSELVAWDDDSGGDGNFAVQFAPVLSGMYYLRVIVYAASGPCLYDLAWQRAERPGDMTLSDALDTEGEVWGTYGDSNWFPQVETSHDGRDAARAGGITDNQTSVLAKVVNGPGNAGFWWRASSELNYDTLSFSVDEATNAVISGDTGWQYFMTAIGEGSHDLRWTFAKDQSDSNHLDTAFVDQFSFTPEGQPLPLFPGGDGNWFEQSEYNHDGTNAHQSALIASNQITLLQTFVEGPGTLDYWWKVSSENGYDVLTVAADGRTNAAISGEVDWQPQSITLWRPGPREITWAYSKDASVNDGLDAAWVDSILWTPIPRDRDSDGDGQPDWEEGVAGTDPWDTNSVFGFVYPLTGWQVSEGEAVVLQWASSTGIFYNIERSEDLTADPAFYFINSHIPGEEDSTRYEDNPDAGTFYYRISVDQ